MGNILKKYKTILITPVIALIMMFVAMQEVSAANAPRASWAVLIDDSAYTLVGFVVEDTSTSSNNALENKTTGISTGCSVISMKTGDITNSSVPNPTPVGTCDVVDENARVVLAWTFPPSTSVDATSADTQQAEWVNSVLVDSFNMATAKVINSTDLQFKSRRGYPRLLNVIANDTYAVASSGTQQSFHHTFASVDKNKSVDYTIAPVSAKELQAAGYTVNGNTDVDGVADWTVNSFVKFWMTEDGEDTAIVLAWQVPKGYSPGQSLYGRIVEEAGEDGYAPRYLGWSHIAYQASFSYFEGIHANNPTAVTGESESGNVITDLLQQIVQGVGSMLGLYSIEDLTLNRGTRSLNYYKGIMPRNWFSGISLLYWFFQIIAIMITATGFIKLMIEKNASVINPGKRVELMERIQALVIGVVMMLMFIPFFALLATLNETIIAALAAMIPANASLSVTMGGGIIVGIIVNIAFLFIMFKINVTYIIRAITVAILYATAPLFISMYTFGESGKQRFQIWIKELVVNIFMQTFNGIMTAIFLLAFRYASLSVVEKFALLMSYIALSDYFKNTLMDARSGADGIDDGASRVLGTVGGTALAGVVGGGLFKSSKSGEKSESGGKHSSDSSGDGVGIQTSEQKRALAAGDKPTPANRGAIGNMKANAKKGLSNTNQAIKNKIGSGKFGDKKLMAYEAVGKGLKHGGKALGAGLAEAPKMAALAGITMGMESIGANSFSARTRLAGAGAGIASQMGSEWDEYKEELGQISADNADGNINGEAYDVNQSFMTDRGIKDAYIPSAGNTKGWSGGFNSDGNEIDDFSFADDEKYVHFELDEGSVAYAELNNPDRQKLAMQGIGNMMEKYRQNSDNPDNFKYQYRVNDGMITGIDFSANKNAVLKSYGSGTYNRGNTVLKYRVKGLNAFNVNGEVKQAVLQRNKFGKQ